MKKNAAYTILTLIVGLIHIGTQGQIFTNTANVTLPQPTANAYSDITVSGVGTIDNSYGLVTVTISIMHTANRDVDAWVVAPDGTEIMLTTDNGGTSDNYINTVFSMSAVTSVIAGTGPFTNTYRPEGNLGTFNSCRNANGVWRLRVQDDANNADAGYIDAWSLNFGTSPAPGTFCPPVNDLPCGAVSLSVSSNCVMSYFSNEGATNSGVTTPTCGSYGGQDVWFSVVVPSSGTITIETQQVDFSDACLAVYSGPNCSTLSQIGCDDDSGPGNMPLLGVSGRTPGETLWIRVWEYGGGTVGDFGICVYNPTPNTQDCLGAIPICGDTYSTTISYSGTGNVAGEINGSISCLASGERNDVWYVFTVQQNGNLMFTITPNNASDDYDWAVYNLTTSSCSDIATDASLEVSCNYSGDTGPTGPDGSTTQSHQGASGSAYNAAIPVNTGEVYAINVSNFSSTQFGYTIDFSMASGVIVDITPPELDTIVNTPTCGQNAITVWFNELVDTSTVNAGDFTVTGPGGPYSILVAAGTSATQNDREYTLSLDAQLIAGGSYNLVFSGQVDDACGNTVIGNSLPFTVQGVSGSVVVNDGTVVCYDDAVGSAVASASGGSGTYSYSWSTGATTATITNLVAGNYTVTVTDNVGVCYDIITATVNASNPFVATGTWAGTVSSDWNNCANWGGGRVPLASTDVVIPGGCTFYPVLSSNTTINGGFGICKSIKIMNGGTMTLSGAAGLTINSALVTVESGGSLNVGGSILIGLGGELRQTGGSVSLSENFINNDLYTATSGSVHFIGSADQEISGSVNSSFVDLEINKTTGVLRLQKSISVSGNLTFTSGRLDITDKQIDLSTTGSLVNETEVNGIYSSDGFGSEPNAGTVTADRLNPSGNVAGMGLNITPSSPLGNTTITRCHLDLMGSGSYSSNNGIWRYYEITPGSKSVNSIDVTFSYFDSELNGHVDGTLVMFQEVQYYYAGSPGPVFFQPLPTINNGTINTASASTSANGLDYIRITLGSTAGPLPVEMNSFEAICLEESSLIQWQTSSETNNAWFSLQKSDDGIHFSTIATLAGHGTSNIIQYYSFEDTEMTNAKAYYRLVQTDLDGQENISQIIVSDCHQESGASVSITVNTLPDNEYIIHVVNSDVDQIKWMVYDASGRQVPVSVQFLGNGLYSVNLCGFSAGVYHLTSHISGSMKTIRLVR